MLVKLQLHHNIHFEQAVSKLLATKVLMIQKT